MQRDTLPIGLPIHRITLQLVYPPHMLSAYARGLMQKSTLNNSLPVLKRYATGVDHSNH